MMSFESLAVFFKMVVTLKIEKQHTKHRVSSHRLRSQRWAQKDSIDEDRANVYDIPLSRALRLWMKYLLVMKGSGLQDQYYM